MKGICLLTVFSLLAVGLSGATQTKAGQPNDDDTGLSVHVVSQNTKPVALPNFLKGKPLIVVQDDDFAYEDAKYAKPKGTVSRSPAWKHEKIFVFSWKGSKSKFLRDIHKEWPDAPWDKSPPGENGFERKKPDSKLAAQALTVQDYWAVVDYSDRYFGCKFEPAKGWLMVVYVEKRSRP